MRYLKNSNGLHLVCVAKADVALIFAATLTRAVTHLFIIFSVFIGLLGFGLMPVTAATLPLISAMSPQQILNTPTPVISANYAAAPGGAALDLNKIVLQVDGVNVTAKATKTATAIRYQPSSALTQGSHQVILTVSDVANNVNTASWNFVLDSVPPVIFPQTGVIDNAIGAEYSDEGVGIDLNSAVLSVDGIDVSVQSVRTLKDIRYAPVNGWAEGDHSATLVVQDQAQNYVSSFWTFSVGRSGPVISRETPKEVLLAAASRPMISAAYQDPRGIDRASVHLSVNGVDVTQQAQVSTSAISYTPLSPLAAGHYSINLSVANKGRQLGSALWGFEVDEQKTYQVAITSPAGSQTVVTPKVTVTATAQANRSTPSRVVLNGTAMTLNDTDANDVSHYSGNVDLIDGPNTLTVQATFLDGQVRSTSLEVRYDAPPKVTITSPSDKSMFGRANATSPGDLTGNVERPVSITGRVSKAVQKVIINQQQATLLNGGTEFRFDNFFLHEGMNMLNAVATDANGRSGSAAIQVSVDQTAPILSVEAPLADSITSSSKIDIRGVVNDAVEGFTGAPEPSVSVSVNGITKTGMVADRFYLVTDVPLQIGVNKIVVSAQDQFGNSRTQEVKVSRIAVGSERLTLLSGNHQSAGSITELAKPLVVVALNAAGEPLANLPISFDVMRGTGSISTVQGQATKPDGVNPARNLIVNTDAAGRAQVWLTTGKQSGPGGNLVKVGHPRLAEEVSFVATTLRGSVAKVNADLGVNQFAETGSQPLELLSLVVRDREDNPLPNVPVVFTIAEGDAYFVDSLGAQAQDGGKRIVVNTDKNGLTALRPGLGNNPGNVRIVAQALKDGSGDVNNPSDLTGNATYYIQVKQAKDGPANYSGVVYTDKGKPLPGVRVSIGRTALASTTGAQGRFELSNIPPGRIDLFIDGRTVNPNNDPALQQWPSLHFEAYAVRGQNNTLAHPIYLPPLLTSEAKVVGGNQDVVLKMPGLEGFQMKVKANSVTFPDGSHVGTLVVSPVTADKLPMAPPSGGATFGIPAWTIQPAGTRFDPPIEVQLPNARANPVGDNIPIVQWDHDLGQYVPMGRATVTEDGAFLVTDAGSGITKAGWGGLCVYDPFKCLRNALRICTDCETRTFVDGCPLCQKDLKKDSSPLKMPAPSDAPSKVDRVATSGLGDWGKNNPLYDDQTIVCKKLCVNGEEKYGLDGDVTPNANWKITVFTVVQAPKIFVPKPEPLCLPGSRTEANIQRTINHEIAHIKFHMSVINAAKAKIGQLYASVEACEAAKIDFKMKLEADWKVVVLRQREHCDFRGQPAYAAKCVNGKSVEIQDGVYDDRYGKCGR